MSIDRYEIVGDSLNIHVVHGEDAVLMSLEGSLEVGNAGMVERQLLHTLRDPDVDSIVVSLRELGLLDAAGAEALLRVIREDGAKKLRWRVLESSHVMRRLRAAGIESQMAMADVSGAEEAVPSEP